MMSFSCCFSKTKSTSLFKSTKRYFAQISKLQVEDNTAILANGMRMPLLAFGTWKSPPGDTKKAVVGAALTEVFKNGIVKRSDLFVQSKLWNSNHRPEHVIQDLQATLDDLQLDYIDSFVIHWAQAAPSSGLYCSTRLTGPGIGHYSKNPMFPTDDHGYFCTDLESHYIETYEAMEQLIDNGLVKSIGLSNFNRTQIKEVLDSNPRYHPTVLQNECHPYLQQKDLIDFCKINNIQFQAFSALGSGGTHMGDAGPPPNDTICLQNPLILELAEKYNVTPAQIILRWNVQRGVSVVTKSIKEDRIINNGKIFDFEISTEDMTKFDSINYGWRHLLWKQASNHPDYPFKDELPWNYVLQKAPTVTSSGN